MTTSTPSVPRISSLKRLHPSEDAIVIDLGSLYVKCGLSGESSPRVICPWYKFEIQSTPMIPGGYQVPTELCPLYSLETNWETELGTVEQRIRWMLDQIFFRQLVLDPTTRKILFARKITWPTKLENVIVKACKWLQIPEVDFIDSNVLALLSAGKTNGLVVDCGWNETTIVPVFDSRPMINSIITIPTAGKTVNEELQKSLSKSTEQLEDVKAKMCFVESRNPKNEGPEWKLDETLMDYTIRWQCTEALFLQDNLEITTIPQAIIACVESLPIDLKPLAMSQLCLVGGTTMLPGFRSRLVEEIEHYKKNTKLKALKVDIIPMPFSPHTSLWIGASLAAVLRRTSIPEFEQ